MFIEFTIYPIPGREPEVGFNSYRTAAQPRFKIAGSPNMKIHEFDAIIRGTNQYNEYLHECARLGIDLKQWIKD